MGYKMPWRIAEHLGISLSFYPLRTLLIVLCFAMWQAMAQVPRFTDVTAADGTRPNAGHAIAIDPSGNSYVAGSFGFDGLGGTLDLTTTNLVSLGDTDGFLAKFDSQGQCLWARQFAGLESNDAYDVVVRPDGSILVTGEFVGTNAIGTATSVSQGGLDIFLAAFSVSGDLLWARAIGGTLDDFAVALAPSSDGSALFTGSFSGDIDLDGGISFSSADDDALLIKLNPAGGVQWARRAGGEGYQLGSDVKVDTVGNVFWVGEFETNILFDAATLTSDSFNVFMAAYDSAGTRLWSRKLGDGEIADLPRIALGPDGRMLCTAVYFGEYAIGNEALPSGIDDVLLASFSAAGDLQWATTFGGDELDACTDLLVDSRGDIYLTGHFRGTMMPNVTSAGSTDIFVVRCASDGQLQGAIRAGGLGPDLSFSAAFAPLDGIRLTGSFSGAAQFGNISVTSADGLPKAFIAIMAPPPQLRITSVPPYVLVSWPGNAADLSLESSPDLLPATWNPVGITPVLVNGEFVVTNQAAAPNQFFRLTD